MCGILGLIHDYKKSFDIKDFEKLNDLNKRRGPDYQSKIEINLEKVCLKLGHTRLSIQDLSNNANQPMESFTGRFIISYNGEIYNHNFLRKKIEAKTNIKWNSTSDTETLLNLFEFFEIETVLNMISGMFSFILFDKKNNNLTIARDKIGEKPLYVNFDNSYFMISSDLKAIQSFPFFQKKISKYSLNNFFKYNYIPAPNTIFENVFKLPSGSFITIDINKFNLNSYKEFDSLISNKSIKFYHWWNINIDKNIYKKINKYDARDLVQESLKQSVKEQLISDAPIGAFLSGGIDSALIVSLMQQIQKQTNTFTIGFENVQYDESFEANKIANYLSTNHINYHFSNSEVLKFIKNTNSVFSEPFADSSQIPTLLVSKIAKEKVKVVLTGDGGDELFGGYNRYIYANKYWKFLKYFNPNIRNLFIKNLINISPNLFISIVNFLTKIKINEQSLLKIYSKIDKITDEYSYYKSLTNEWNNEDNLLKPSVLEDKDNNNLKDIFSNKSLSFEEKMMLSDLKSYLPDDIMCKVDRSTMYYGIESRAPFLNGNLINLAYNLPIKYKLKNGKSKIILKDILKQYLPEKLVNKSKKGFGIPIGDLIRNELRDWSNDILSKNNFSKHNLLNYDTISRTQNEHMKNTKNNQHKLWSLIQFNLWYENTF